ncbi:hypothetical protein Lfu02_27200 [Longispora fulva]|uniref:DUF397 domain-containing protein n=1 Tax=Longispora fulva TaxID=619741 RepID=A0A8J7KHQ9_9ACTN|nr:DUF397 domain-containing protein [Longispora fulva]MBG6138855.1 hypothetical protein [Longispora fulva]GIG58348.1 hypothetical protein Lfu02_27200 [Longispora fulva]
MELNFKKSTRSGNDPNGCVEVARTVDGAAVVRDSKQHGLGPLLTYPSGEWLSFLGGVKAGDFDRAPGA